MRLATVCFKHRCLMSNCKCNSPLQITISYRTRIPAKSKLNRWKEFIDYLNSNIKASNKYYRDNKPLIDKKKIVKSW